jgi:hypothetical protein
MVFDNREFLTEREDAARNLTREYAGMTDSQKARWYRDATDDEREVIGAAVQAATIAGRAMLDSILRQSAERAAADARNGK